MVAKTQEKSLAIVGATGAVGSEIILPLNPKHDAAAKSCHFNNSPPAMLIHCCKINSSNQI